MRYLRKRHRYFDKIVGGVRKWICGKMRLHRKVLVVGPMTGYFLGYDLAFLSIKKYFFVYDL
jgi:hypothetical protein